MGYFVIYLCVWGANGSWLHGFSTETGWCDEGRAADYAALDNFDGTLGYPGEGPDDGEAGDEEKRTISLFRALGLDAPAAGLKKARAKAASRPVAKKGLEVYYANVSSWSPKAQGYVEHRVDADVLAFVETKLHGREQISWTRELGK